MPLKGHGGTLGWEAVLTKKFGIQADNPQDKNEWLSINCSLKKTKQTSNSENLALWSLGAWELVPGYHPLTLHCDPPLPSSLVCQPSPGRH